MADYTLVAQKVRTPALVVHGGAGSYLQTTTRAQRLDRGQALLAACRAGWDALAVSGGRGAVLASVGALELDTRFNAGRGSRLQRDGRCRLSAALMDGGRLRLSAVYNVQSCLHPSQLAAALQARGDRNLDGEGAARLMAELGVAPTDLRTRANIARWEALVEGRGGVDPEAAIGDADGAALAAAHDAGLEVPSDLSGPVLPPPDRRHGTVGAVAVGADGVPWACTSTGGRGHEVPGRVSDSPTATGTYACSHVAVSATGFGEQIMDLNIAGRIATRVLDGASLEHALRRTFDEVRAHEGLLGVIAACADGTVGYAHTTPACGVAWIDAAGDAHLDPHGR